MFKSGGEVACIEAVIDSDDLLHVARALYQRTVMRFPGRLVMLCQWSAPLPACWAISPNCSATGSQC
jgi:hypothetical protein